MIILKLVDKIGFDEGDMQNEITEDNMADVLVCMEMTKNALNHMHGVFEQIFMPLLHNEANSRQWTELVSKDLIEKFNNYLAQTFVTMG
jgi:dynein heavy chain